MVLTWTPPVSHVAGVYAWGGFAIISNLGLPRLTVTSTSPDTSFLWRSEGVPSRPDPMRSIEITTRGGGIVRVEVCGDGVVRYGVEKVGVFEIHAAFGAIDFFPRPASEPMHVEHYLVNSVLPIYAGLRSVVCLHAAAVATDKWATVFTGPPGSGKSTLAVRAIAGGAALLGDDAVVLRKRGDTWFVPPGSRTVRLEEPPAPDSWRCGPKFEAVVPFEDRPVPMREIVVLDRAGSLLATARQPAILFRALVSLQPAWLWGPTQARRELASLTADLCQEESSGDRGGDRSDSRGYHSVVLEPNPATRAIPDAAQRLQDGRLV
jgi:hypothetical protein